MMKALVLAAIFLFSTLAMAADQDDVKKCLDSYYSFQQKCLKQYEMYCPEDKYFDKTNCNGVGIVSAMLPKNKYLAVAKKNKSIWVLESNKNIIFIQ
jgi:hypothetical protein